MTFKHAHGAGRDQLPDSLGAQLSADSLSVVFASDASLPVSVDPGDQNYGAVGADTTRVAAMLGLGSTAVSNANPVPISDAGGAITVDGTVAVTGVATAANQSTAIGHLATLAGAVGGTEMQVDVLSSALPSGAATSANQATEIASLATIAGAVSGVEMQVDIVSSALPSGAATEATLSAASAKLPAALGQLAMAASLSVTIASNQSAVSVTSTNLPATVDTNSGAAGASTLRSVLATRHESASTPVSVRISNGSTFATPDVKGRAYADSTRKDYSGGSVTTGAWTQLIASTAADINALMVFDSSGQTMELGTGAAASETRVLIVPPGGLDGPVPLYIASGTRLSVRAVSATASTGELDITGLN